MAAQYHHLGSSADFPELLSKPDNFNSETIKLCGNILKINKRNKRQQRIFMLTGKAIYNIKPQNNQIKRRINLLDIASITFSSASAQFAINIPSEYDYHFDAVDVSFQNEIIRLICQQIINLQHQIFINQISDATTNKWTVTKNVLKTVNSHYDPTVRTVMALDHLIQMGFKSKMAYKALKENGIDLSVAMQSLISEQSPFRSKTST
eukprot:UN04355